MQDLTLNQDTQHLTEKYIWWESTDWALKHPYLLLTIIMDRGVWDDWCLMQQIVTPKELREVLTNAPPGYFHWRSWDYWHLKLNVSPVPPLPTRKDL